MDPFLHERAYRGRDAMDRISAGRVVVIGADGPASLLIDSLARQGVQQIVVADRERVSAQDVLTGVYTPDEVGRRRAEVISARIYRALSQSITTSDRTLNRGALRGLLAGASLVVLADTNEVTRAAVRERCVEAGIPFLSLGRRDQIEARWAGEFPMQSVGDDPIAALACAAMGGELCVRALAGEGHAPATLPSGWYQLPAREAWRRRTITLCGAGALGSHLAERLARLGVARLRIIDDDVVSASNRGTQVYDQREVGQPKVTAITARLYRAGRCEVTGHQVRLTAANADTLLAGSDLVVDAFDNSESRQLVTDTCAVLGLPCLHTGMHSAYGEAIWNDRYRVPGAAPGMDVCEYPLARNLVLLVTMAGVAAVAHFLSGTISDTTITLGDMTVDYSPVRPITTKRLST